MFVSKISRKLACQLLQISLLKTNMNKKGQQQYTIENKKKKRKKNKTKSIRLHKVHT